jgi:hypothetical protein
MSTQNLKFKNGNEYDYAPSKNLDSVALTYVGPLKDGLHRFFLTESPSVDYHLDPSVSKIEEIQYAKVDPAETYIAFAGKDEEKRKAYLILLRRRGIKAEC